jgi:hypothetical protein
MDQISIIDQKVENWGSFTRPNSDNLYLYLGISVIIIVGMGIMIINARRNTARVQKKLIESNRLI